MLVQYYNEIATTEQAPPKLIWEFTDEKVPPLLILKIFTQAWNLTA